MIAASFAVAFPRLPWALLLGAVALTAHALEEERRKCLDAGMNDFLLKPVDPAALRTLLQRWSPVR